ncbi:MAG: undecaprenyl-diphosphate phosphatase [Candidatus Andersenbacteria bacterium]
MITLFQAIVLGLLQGISELFPISSLGHSVIFPALFGWKDLQHDPYFLNFLVGTHLATALVLIGFYWTTWIALAKGFFASLKNKTLITTNPDAKLAWLLIIGTIPAGLLGLIFEHKLKTLFAIPVYAALFLFINGVVLYVAELLPKKTGSNIQSITFKQALYVGVAQIVALFPGFSRTGATITGGLFAGLTHEDSVKYSFLLATPIIFAASVLKLPGLLHGAGTETLLPTIIGALSAGLAAFFAVKFLTKFFQTNTLKPFAIYCMIAGALAWMVIR